jgi:short-subunit dehydrogenase
MEPKVVLITGASSGLGAAAAEACARAGHSVALAARRMELLEEVAARIARPEATLLLRTDIRDPDGIGRMVAETQARFGRIDALVANAGVGRYEPFVQSTEERLAEMMEVNVLGVIRSARAVLPAMLARKSGHILTVASVAAELPLADSAVYAATKGAVLAFSEALRREVAREGVHVTAVLPGFIATDMTVRAAVPMPRASVVGDLIAELIRRPRPRAVVPRYYGAAIWGARLAPRIADRVMELLRRKLEERRSG